MKIAILTCGMLPIPAVQGGAVENLIDFYLEYNDRKKLYDMTVYSPWDARVAKHPALASHANHYVFIDVTSLKARIARRLYGSLHHGDYYNHFIEYYFEQVYKDLRRKSYDCIILENCPGYACKLSRRGYKNLVLHLHNELLHAHSRCHDTIFNSLSKILTVSDYIKGRVSTIQSNIKTETIYNGIDLKRFSISQDRTITRQSLGFSDRDFVVVYSGRINQEKGVSELIDAMLLLKDAPDIKLMILGGSFFGNALDEDDFIRSLKEKAEQTAGRIVFTGFIRYEDMARYLRLADAAVLPSIWEEPFGLTCVETMAAGLPLITTHSGGIPEICEGVATIVGREHVADNLAAAIRDLYEHPEKRKQMGKASLERAQLFDKETYARNFLAALERL